MTEENIVRGEFENEGKQVHLYFDVANQEYKAYGMSAYVVCHTIAGMPQYSQQMQMPVMAVDNSRLSKLKKKLEEIIQIENEYFRFDAKDAVKESAYISWASQVRENGRVV